MSCHLLLLSILLACGENDTGGSTVLTQPTNTETACIDADSDGVCAEDDCNDDYNLAYEGAMEIPYNGLDEDCDGEDMADFDEDGFDAVEAGGTDCNDGNPEIYPGAWEECYYAEQDYNCDDQFGGDDCDFDGFDRYEDCNDEDPSVYPNADDPWYDGVDQDCEGNSDYDMDYDGDDSDQHGGLDCDESNPLIGGALPELWDGYDNDCDDIIDVIASDDATMTYDATAGVGDEMWGGAVTIMGDIDGDGYAEVATGDLGKNDMTTEALYVGGVYITSSGLEDGRPEDVAIARISGSAEYDTVGWSVASGDLDGDGLADLITGAPFLDEAYVYTATQLQGGAELGIGDAVATINGGTGFGGSLVHVMGDVTGDGISEVVFSTSDYDSAYTMVMDGADLGAGGSFSSGTALALLNESGKVIGDIASEVDLTGDGLPDLVVGCSYCDGDGLVYLLEGDTLTGSNIVTFSDYESLTVTAGVLAKEYGMSVGVMPDIDGDGYPEVAVADPFLNKWAGKAWLFSSAEFGTGSTVADIAIATIEGQMEEGMLKVGHRYGDNDGDGVADLFVSEPGTFDAWSAKQGDYPPQGDGSLYWFSGDTLLTGGTFSTEEADAVLTSATPWVGFGIAFDVADRDGDGLSDVTVGVPLNSTGKLYHFDSSF